MFISHAVTSLLSMMQASFCSESWLQRIGPTLNCSQQRLWIILLDKKNRSWFLERVSAVKFFKCSFWLFEHHKLSAIYIWERQKSVGLISPKLSNTHLYNRWMNHTTANRKNMDFCFLGWTVPLRFYQIVLIRKTDPWRDRLYTSTTENLSFQNNLNNQKYSLLGWKRSDWSESPSEMTSETFCSSIGPFTFKMQSVQSHKGLN